MSRGVYTLPEGLPAPVDDGVCRHLVGIEMPPLVLDSSQGPVDLAGLAARRLVLYVKAFYPAFPPDANAAEVVAWLRRRAA